MTFRAPILAGLMIALSGALMLALAGCATNYTETETEVRFTYGPGGLLTERRAFYAQFYGSEKRMVLDGQFNSADAFYAFALPKLCYTRNIVWSPHAVSAGSLRRLGPQTERIMLHLPQPMQDYFRDSSYYWEWIKVPEIRYDELIQIWPKGSCEAQGHKPQGG